MVSQGPAGCCSPLVRSGGGNVLAVPGPRLHGGLVTRGAGGTWYVMANILMMGRSKELSKVRAAHMEAALQTQVKTEPVNAITTAVTEKKKGRQKGATSSQTYVFFVVIHFLIKEALSKRAQRNDKMSRKRRAKQRDIRIGDHVLVCNRRSGSTFMLPFEKDPWVVSHMARGGMEIEQTFSPATVSDGDDEGSVDFSNRRFPLPNPRVVVDAPLLAAQEGADMLGSEVPNGRQMWSNLSRVVTLSAVSNKPGELALGKSFTVMALPMVAA
ncbi:hypothetical protein NDU88_006972 [Pleurodeles waltl]|uniref:Uncharacterized protein n=1 Tax=Pleurodeles waltl TaxID=8319 RepID=A0AAV7LYG8_PLEWA|nr:hypothetical protein NDU88_006972 [Pleurodeles waltl]